MRPPAGQAARLSEAKSSVPSASDAKAASRRWGWRRFPTLDSKRQREWMTIRVKYTGGPEAWYLVEARGSTGRFTGVAALHDVMRDIYNDRDTEQAPRGLK